MGLFTRKPKTPEVSVFDSVPQEEKDVVISDIILIVRLLKAWPVRMFPDPILREKAGNEISNVLRRAGMLAVSMFMSAGDEETNSQEVVAMLAKLPIPDSLRPMIVAAYSTFIED